MKRENSALLDLTRKNHCLGCGRPDDIAADGSPIVQAHHVEEKGNGGGGLAGDDWWNVIPLCHMCHTGDTHAWHNDLRAFLDKYPHVKSYLLLLGWEFLPYGHKLKTHHPAYARCKPKEYPEWAIPWDTMRKYLKPTDRRLPK